MPNQEAVSGAGLRGSDIVAPLLLVAFAFAWVYGVGGASTRIMQSYHGLHHAAYVTQIAEGIVPPTNPSSAGEPANFYWAWHAALAFGMATMNVTPFEMSLSSNALGLAMTLCGFWLCASAFSRDPWLRVAACGLPLFILDPLGLLQFAIRIGVVWVPGWFQLDAGQGFGELVELARHHAVLRLTDQDLSHLRPTLGLPFDFTILDRAGHWLSKFLNFNSFPIALGVYALAQDVFVNQRFGSGLRSFGLFVACFTMAVTSPLVAIGFGLTVLAFIMVEGPYEWRALRKTGFAGRKRGLVRFAAPIAGCGAGVLLSLPMLLPIQAAYGGETLWLLGAPGFWRHAVALGWALVPGAVVLVAAALLARDLVETARVHAVSVALLSTAALCVATPRQDPNEYKFVLLSAFPAALLVLGLIGACARRSRRFDALLRHPVWLAMIFLATGALAAGSMALLYLASPWAEQNPLRLEGATTHLAFEGDDRRRALDGALGWLREQTPVESHVFARALDKNEDVIPVVARRRVVVQKASPFTVRIADQPARIAANDGLVEEAGRCRDRASIARALERVRSLGLAFDSAPHLVVERGVGQPVCERHPQLRPVFHNEAWAVYELGGLAEGS